MSKLSFYVIILIYYLSGGLYIGYIYLIVVVDIIVRFKCFCGYDVKFLIGIDEYGEKI